jgi:hypothetical protein
LTYGSDGGIVPLRNSAAQADTQRTFEPNFSQNLFLSVAAGDSSLQVVVA